MIRSLLGGSALLALALASLALGQAGSPAKNPTAGPLTLTVQEPGKTPQTCKIMKYWTEPDGSRAYQVEATDTGEKMTVLETTPPTGKDATAARTVTTRIFRWGKSPTPPAGVPGPPSTIRTLETVSVPASKAPLTTPYPVNLPTTTPVTTTSAKPTEATTPVPTGEWRNSWTKVDTVRPDRGTELPVSRSKGDDPLSQPAKYVATPTKVEQARTTPIPTLANQAVTTTTKTTPMPGATSTPIKKEEPRGLGWLFGAGSTPTATKTAPCPTPCPAPTLATVKTAPIPATPTPTQPSVATVTAAKPKETLAPPLVGQPQVTATPIPTPAPVVVSQPRPVPTPTPVSVTQPKPVPTQVKVVEQPKQTPVKVVEQPKPTPVKVVEQPKQTPVKVVEQPKQTPTTQPGLFGQPSPSGSRSVMAVNSRELREEPKTIAVPGPDGRPIELLPPPNAFGAPRVIETPVPPGLGNAFTEAGNPRPIPADMMRKDLMPPELVAMMEGRYHRPMGGPNAPAVGPNAPPAMAMPQMPQMPQMPMQPQAPVVMQPMLPAPVRQVSGQAALELQRAVLKDSLLPSEREQAADYLSSYEAHRTPVAVAALLDGAKTDPAIMVRVACVRGLGKMRATNAEVVEAIQVMTREGDERLRTACVEVLSLLRQGR